MNQRPLARMVHALCMAIIVAVAVNTLAQVPEKKPDNPTSGPTVPNPFDAVQQFSAVMHGGFTSEDNRQIYRSGNLMRGDFSDQYRITDISIPVTWAIFTKSEKHSCGKFKVADADNFPFWGLKDFKVERVAVEQSTKESDKETVDGHPAKIEQLTFTKDMPPLKLVMKIWEAQDLNGFPVKIEVHNLATKRKFTITYTNVSLHTPEAKLFVHPDDCPEPGQSVQSGGETTVPPLKPPSDSKPVPTSPPQ